MRRLAVGVASLGGVGFLRPGPGTWGSAVVLPLALLPPWAVLGAACVFGLAGWWAVSALEEREADPGWVVVDEAAGMALALAAAATWWQVVLAFGLFRLLDIWKPGPVGWADRRGGAFGVMADDVVAGVLAGVAVWMAGRVA